ncbi:hypothetical protein KG090_03840 [Carnobacteriaceae bacterium zg-ZUI240]|nr:hypothetical protein [Carnobacteriaceae bacterium zg-ZUI240]
MIKNKRYLKFLNIICLTVGNLLILSSFLTFGFLIARLNDKNGFSAILYFVILYTLLYITLLLHELGHAFFGELTGFKTVAISLGKYSFVNQQGHWKFTKKLLIQGAGAQYVGIKKDHNDTRSILMLLGGIIVHISLIFIYLMIGLILNHWLIALPQILINLGFIFLNINPNGITDGAKVLELKEYPHHSKLFYQSLEHAAQLFLDSKESNLSDFYSLDDSLLEPGIICQTVLANVIEVQVFNGNLELAQQKAEQLLQFTENKFIKAATESLLLLIYLLQNEKEKAIKLGKSKTLQTYLKQQQYSLQTIKAYYELECLGDYIATKKSLATADKFLKQSHLLQDDKTFYTALNATLQENLNNAISSNHS